MNIPIFTATEEVALILMRNDLRFLHTAIGIQAKGNTNYILAALPFLAVVINGVDEWVKSFNESHGKNNIKLCMPLLTEEEKQYSEKMRLSIKMWNDHYDKIKEDLGNLYEESNQAFASVCKPVARILRLYDIFGADKINGQFFGNTILYGRYLPGYKYMENDTTYLKEIFCVGGKYTVQFQAGKEYKTNEDITLSISDYGGVISSPVGNKFGDKFVLFSMLCQINFVLYGIEKLIVDECSSKLRFAYLQYFYCAEILDEVNKKNQTNFTIDMSLKNQDFRSAMAHYGVGVNLRKKEEIIYGDPLYGLVQKYFDCNYFELKEVVLNNLATLAIQLKAYLHLK